ncbi:hypothetical protein BD410DRAFT_737920 [Rickenella mellea]|uniref:Uncharacterized protein n=1 Tax=Rickenella mellea TaxID=50990 RepID=A0A4Y7QMP4_9AGAM|nr:hypothetical protein BD410DRAFT_737920 [Rickenella mellea]
MQLSQQLDGVPTDVIIQHFADRILVLVTQLGKVGTLIQATLPTSTQIRLPQDTFPEPPPAIQLTTLMGGAPSEHTAILHSLYVSQIATIVWAHTPDLADRRPVIVGLALKKAAETEEAKLREMERNTFTGVMRIVSVLSESS